jgi:glycosyltransferase involved in cell wall biosynthesis
VVPPHAGRAPGLTIAHLIECDGPGGAERMLVHLVTALAEDGVHNVVLLPSGGEGWVAAQLPHERVSIVHVPLASASVPTSVAHIRRALGSQPIQMAHSHEFTMSVLGAAAAWSLGIPHLFTLHGSRYYASSPARRLATMLAARASHKVVPVSDALARHVSRDLRLGPSTLCTIPNGIPPVPEVAPRLRAELGLPAGARLAVAVGNLYPVKGHTHLLRAMAMLPAAPEVHLAIAGRGPEEEALRVRAKALAIGHRVHFLGLRDDIGNLLWSADVFVLPSLSEALPLALLEAMRASRPIVASAVGEIPAVLEQGRAGMLVPPGDHERLARALTTLLDNATESAALAARARAVADERYDVGRMTDRYRTLYAAALRPR